MMLFIARQTQFYINKNLLRDFQNRKYFVGFLIVPFTGALNNSNT